MLENAFIISLAVLFIHSTTWDGNIFAGIKTIIKPKGNLYKPIYGCPICYDTILRFLDLLFVFLPIMAELGANHIYSSRTISNLGVVD
jgi:hypothetical protein